MNYKVLITTSGVGQRLGDLTDYLNKSLVRLAKKPVLSYIIESYPKEIEIIIAVRHMAQQIKDFVELAYPDRKIVFSEEASEPENGTVFSLARTMLKAKKYLQCPFIFHAGDTVVFEPIPSPLEGNWNGGQRGGSTVNYRSFTELDERVFSFSDKGAIDYDYLHIGLVGIKDYEKFWEVLEGLCTTDPLNSALGDVPVLEKLIKEFGYHFDVKEFKSWLDIGNIEALHEARKKLDDHQMTLGRSDQVVYLFEDFVIKFMADADSVKSQVQRAVVLEGLVPQIEGSKNNFYRYRYVVGRLYSRVVTPSDFALFLDQMNERLWKIENEVNPEDFKKVCLGFYKEKTLKRIEQFYKLTSIKDEAISINGESVPKLSEVLEKIDFNWLADGKQVRIHGDLVLDNIIRTPDSWSLLDWRQDFGGLISAGDLYYDLAKLNHNLTVSHDIIFNNLFKVKVRGSSVFCDILRSENLINCQEILHKFIEKQNLDVKRVKILTALIWLNSSPLHHHPYTLFLHYFGRLNLFKELKLNND
jgi:dTDP-glucose pyrophosphorylase